MERKPAPAAGFFLWGLCAGSILVSFGCPLSALPRESLCWFYNLTHVPCPGCGLTRAFICISHGQWAAAWEWNPFGYIWYGLALYGTIRPLVSRRVPSVLKPFDKIVVSKPFFPVLVGLMFLVWVLKLGT